MTTTILHGHGTGCGEVTGGFWDGLIIGLVIVAIVRASTESSRHGVQPRHQQPAGVRVDIRGRRGLAAGLIGIIQSLAVMMWPVGGNVVIYVFMAAGSPLGK